MPTFLQDFPQWAWELLALGSLVVLWLLVAARRATETLHQADVLLDGPARPGLDQGPGRSHACVGNPESLERRAHLV